MGEGEHFVEELIRLCEGDDDGFLGAEEKEPVVGVVMIEEGEGGVEDDQAAGCGEEGAGDGDAVIAALEEAGEGVVLGGFIAPGFDAEFPGAGVVEFEINQLVGVGVGGEEGAAGSGDHGEEQALERIGDAIGGVVGELGFVARAALEQREDLLVVGIGDVRDIGER